MGFAHLSEVLLTTNKHSFHFNAKGFTPEWDSFLGLWIVFCFNSFLPFPTLLNTYFKPSYEEMRILYIYIYNIRISSYEGLKYVFSNVGKGRKLLKQKTIQRPKKESHSGVNPFALKWKECLFVVRSTSLKWANPKFRTLKFVRFYDFQIQKFSLTGVKDSKFSVYFHPK